MANVTLTKPVVGSTGWGDAVNQNFTDLEGFLNNTNGASQLVQLDGSAALPAADGSRVTGLNGDYVAAGTVAAPRLGVMVSGGGSPGYGGAAPAPGPGDVAKFLRGDATWADPVSPPAVFSGIVGLSSGVAIVDIPGAASGGVAVVSFALNFATSPPADTLGVFVDDNMGRARLQICCSNTGSIANVYWTYCARYNP